MYFVFFLIALLLAAIGVLIRVFKCYWLISGYNTMSEEKKKNVDTEGLGKFVGNYSFFLAGVLAVAGILAAFHLIVWMLADMALVFVSTIFVLIRAQKFDANTKKDDGTMKTGTKVLLGLVVGFITVVLIGVGTLLYFSSLPAGVVVNGSGVEIKGMYGMKVPMSEITDISLKDTIPPILAKTNGSDLGSRLKGNFTLEGLGPAKLFINRDQPPFIYISGGKGWIILNNDDAGKTKGLYEELKNSWKEK